MRSEPDRQNLDMRYLLDELVEAGDNASYFSFVMKVRLSGYTPTVGFVKEFIRLCDANRGVERVFIECIRHGMFIDDIKQWPVFREILTLMVNRRGFGIFSTIWNLRPGIVINHYLRHGSAQLTDSRFEKRLHDVFDARVMTFSRRIAAKNPEYKVKYHERIENVWQRNINLDSVMNDNI